MGNLRGDLSVLGITNLLQALAFSRCEGMLTLDLGTQPRIFFLSPATIRWVRGSRRCQRLEKFLRSSHDREDRTSFARLVREWLLDEMTDLLGWNRGSFRFQECSEAQARQHLRQSPFALFDIDGDLMTLLLESARRADEMPRLHSLIADLDAVPERTEPSVFPHDPALDEEVLQDVLPWIDGSRTVSVILQESLFPRFSVLQVLCRLIQRGAIRLPASAAAA